MLPADFFQKLAKAQKFVFYRLPGEQTSTVLAQYNPEPGEWTASNSGFVFYPFQQTGSNPPLFIDAEDSFTGEPQLFPENLPFSLVAQANEHPPIIASREAFTSFVKESVNAIKKGAFQKVVAARASKGSLPPGFNLLQLFKALCAKYPQAFISMVHDKDRGTWVGASPELLLASETGLLQTMALAGTRSEVAGQNWTKKEEDEQIFVKEYINQVFSQHGLSCQISDTTELDAGNNLKHLINRIFASTSGNYPFNQLQSLIYALHPTPAVAGLPKQAAIEWILQKEPLERRYYSGFLGPVSQNQNVQLFVNLRCVQIIGNEAILYAGAGITALSDPEKEWEETNRKMEIISSVINNLSTS